MALLMRGLGAGRHASLTFNPVSKGTLLDPNLPPEPHRRHDT